jgi:hypothetical protein
MDGQGSSMSILGTARDIDRDDYIDSQSNGM